MNIEEAIDLLEVVFKVFEQEYGKHGEMEEAKAMAIESLRRAERKEE